MSIRSDLLSACMRGNRWNVSSAPAAGTTVSAQVNPPSNYDSRHNVESVWYSIRNQNAANTTVNIQVRSASIAGTVLASVQHIVLPNTSANAQFPSLGFVTKRGMGLVFTTDNIVSSVTQCVNAAGWTEDVSTTVGIFDQTYIRALSPVAWFRFNQGNTVSQWTDQSGNGNHLLQSSVAAQPTIATDGSYVFDGIAQYMKCNAFTLNQPESIYLLMQQIGWTSTDRIFDGNALNTGIVAQVTSSPMLQANAGTVLSASSDLSVGVYGVMSVVFNGAGSRYQINNIAAITGNAGASNMGGFTLAANGSNGQFSNIQVKEIIIFADAHDQPTSARVISYLKTVGQLSF